MDDLSFWISGFGTHDKEEKRNDMMIAYYLGWQKVRDLSVSVLWSMQLQ